MAKTLTKEEKQLAHEDAVSKQLQEQAAQKELQAKHEAETDAQARKLAQERGALPAPMTKAQFKEIMKAYELQNPIKYALKKDEFEKKLASLK